MRLGVPVGVRLFFLNRICFTADPARRSIEIAKEILFAIGTRARLLAVTSREFEGPAGEGSAPTSSIRSFEPARRKGEAFGRARDAKRGPALRLAAVLLKDDGQAMERRVCSDERT